MILVTYNIDGKVNNVSCDNETFGNEKIPDVAIVTYNGRVQRITPEYDGTVEDMVTFFEEGCHHCNDGRINPTNMCCHECGQENKF